MRILGIDPGMATMGYGVIDYSPDGIGDAMTLIDYGIFTTPADIPTSERLRHLYREISRLIELRQPAEAAVELFVARNVRSALLVGQARGVAILAAAEKGLPVYEYTPSQVKQSVAGYGRGRKEQVQEMVRIQLGLNTCPQPDDAADALAVAICHCAYSRMARLLEKGE